MTPKERRVDEMRIMTEFLTTYNTCQPHEYILTGRPDRETSSERDVDGYAEADGAPPLAIETTLIQSMRGQKEDDAVFVRYWDPLQQRIRDRMPVGVDLQVPHFGLRVGHDWERIVGVVEEWLLEHGAGFPVGYTPYCIPGVPFEVAILNDPDCGIPFYIGRPSPKNVLQSTVDVVVVALADKSSQFQKYGDQPCETVLILESDDFVLTNPIELYKAYILARREESAGNISQVWLARSFEAEDVCKIYCFDAPEPIMDCVNPRNLGWGRQHGEYWDRVLAQSAVA